MLYAKAPRSILDPFVPEGLESIDVIKRWRFVVLMGLIAVAASAAYAIFFGLLGMTRSALVLAFNGVFIVSLLMYARHIGRLEGCLVVGAIVTMATLSFLTIATAGTSLAFLMWFSIVPPTGALGLGLRRMWGMAVGALVLGAAALALPHFAVVPTSNAISDSHRDVIEASSWLMFMACAITAGYMLHVLNERAEKERQKFHAMTENSRRMQALGELAGGVAHEFNNLLTVIRGTAGHMRRGGPQSPEIESGLLDIEQAASRGGEIAMELLLFARGRPEASICVADTTETLHASLRFFAAIVGSGIQVVSSIPEGLPHVAINARTLEQSLLNMAVNARDAITSGHGEIRVEATALVLDAAEARVLGIAGGSWVRIIVQDDGIGMDDATVARIYEPFFTTKKTGTGLGMAVVFGLLHQIGGAIEVTSTLGVGTKISIYLPVASNGADTKVDADGADPVAIADEETSRPIVADAVAAATLDRILVVEDRQDVRRMVSRILHRAGYEVLEAADGVEALYLLQAGPEFQLIVCDVRMPMMGGAQLAEELLKRNIQVPIVFMTGFAGSEEDDRRLSSLGKTVLRKPFAPEDLLKATAACIKTAGDTTYPGSPGAA